MSFLLQIWHFHALFTDHNEWFYPGMYESTEASASANFGNIFQLQSFGLASAKILKFA